MDNAPKQCSRCKEWLHESQFHRNRAKADGFGDWCKPCMRNYMRAKYRGQKPPPPVIEKLMRQFGTAAGARSDVAGHADQGLAKTPTESDVVQSHSKGNNPLRILRHCRELDIPHRASAASLARVKLKRCPGWDKRKIRPGHRLPATREYFHASSSSKDGLQVYCIKCTRAYAIHARKTWNAEREARKAANEAKVAI